MKPCADCSPDFRECWTDPRRCRKQPVNQLGQRLGPGAWVDRTGALHFSIPEILEHLGLPDTPANRDVASRFVRDFISQTSPDTQIIHRP